MRCTSSIDAFSAPGGRGGAEGGAGNSLGGCAGRGYRGCGCRWRNYKTYSTDKNGLQEYKVVNDAKLTFKKHFKWHSLIALVRLS